MSIYKYSNSTRFLNDLISSQPKNGHGIASAWARVLSVSTALISQILAGKKTLSLEMADKLAKHLALTLKEKDFFFLLIEHERAGTASLREYFSQKIAQAKEDSRHLKNRIENAKELSAEAKTQFYSQWLYSGIRNLVACPSVQTPEAIAEKLKIPLHTVSQVLEFLMQHGLVVEEKKGWSPGPQSTYISPDSPLVYNHHQNWRLRATQRMNEKWSEDLFYTSPMSLSEDLAKQLRSHLLQVIQDLQKQVGPSPSEVVRCLNIDWFQY